MSNPKFKIKDGVLIKCKDNGCAVIEVPDSVNEIGENAFNTYDSRNVRKIILPNTVKKINRNAFSDLESLNIPSSVEFISKHMFEDKSEIKNITFEDSYLVEKYDCPNSEIPLPYISSWPLPINPDTYRQAFKSRPDIKRIFINYSRSFMKAVSTHEFLSLIDDVCKIKKFYMSYYECNGNLISENYGSYKFSHIIPADICFSTMPDHFSVQYTKYTLRELSDGWPGCRVEKKTIRSNEDRAVCFDTSQDDMSQHYGSNAYIELLEKIEDSSVYNYYAEYRPQVIKIFRERENNTLVTSKP